MARLVGYNAHKLAILRPFLFELHMTIAFCEQRVITTDADIHTCMNSRSALANNNIASNDSLAAIYLDAQPFGFRIATVLTTAACFLMCHCTLPVCRRCPINFLGKPENLFAAEAAPTNLSIATT
jgi:hypothetical protein